MNVEIKILIALFLLGEISASPLVKSGVSECYNHVCPDGTFSCKRHSYVSRDKKRLEITISCLDVGKRQLKSFHKVQANPYRPDLSYESYSYSSVYLFERKIPVHSKRPEDADKENFDNNVK